MLFRSLRPEIDSAVAHLYDKSVTAEVECYRINKKKLKREYEELRQIQHDIWKRELTIGGCARRMAGARIYQRIEMVNRAGCASSWMSTRPVAVDVDPEGGVMLRSDFTYLRRHIGLHCFPFFSPLSMKPVYDTI